MEIDEAEAEIVRQMAAKFMGGFSYKDIAYWLNEQGTTTAEGKPWYPITIRNTLRRPRYAGIRVHNGAQYPAKWPAVFDVATWEKLQLTIKLGADKFSDRPKARRYLLTGRVYCGKPDCGHHLNGENRRDRKDRPMRRIYHCRCYGDTKPEGGCGGVAVNAPALEWYIREQVFARLESADIAELLKADEPNDDKLKTLLDQRHAQQLRLDGLVDDYASGLLTKAELARAKSKAQAELDRINGDIHVLNSKRRRTGLLPVGESLRQAWDENDSIAWRGSLIDLVVERIDIMPDKGKPFVMVDGVRMRFNKERVKITWADVSELDLTTRLAMMLRVARSPRQAQAA